MEKYEIELYEPMRINGRLRAAGWTGIVTQSIVTLMRRQGAGRVVRKVEKAEELLKEELAGKTVDELKDILRERDEKLSGSKPELIDRVVVTTP